MQSQNEAILEYLKSGNSLTPMDALNLFKCWALSSRIADLKKEGYDIKSEMVRGENGKHYAKYSLKNNQEQLTLGV